MIDELKDIDDPRLAQMLEVIFRFAAGDLTARGELSDDDSALDGVMAGINILGEELQASVAENQRALEFANTLIRTSPNGILAVDLELRITEWNLLMEQMCGKSREQAIGLNLAEISFMRETGEVARIREGLEGKSIGPREVVYRIPGEDKARFFESYMAPLRGGEGQIVGGVLRVRDITRRKLEQQALQDSEAQLSAIFNATQDGILVADVQTKRFRMVNDAICRMLGYSQDELLNLSVNDIHPEKDLPNVAHQFERQLNGEISLVTLPVKRKDGSVFYADINAAPVNLDGRLYLIGVFRDITDRMQAQQALSESEALLRGVFDSVQDGIIVADAQTRRFQMVNASICRMLGYSADELLKRGVEGIHPTQDLAYVISQFDRLALGEIGLAPSLPMQRKDGSIFYADVNTGPMMINGVASLVGVFRDITERKQAEEKILNLNESLERKVQQLTEAQDELVRKERLAMLGQVAGSVGHELRNPLGVMNNAVYFLQTVLADADETTREYLGILKDEIVNADRIVGDLLDSVRTKPPQPGTVGVGDLINQTLRKCEMPGNVTVTLGIPETLPPLWVDAQQIHQVLRNLISNGIEAMPAGGTLEIRAVESSADKTITISVRDTGVGITPEGMERLFQPLFTTKARGIGLGLVVVKNLTEANGGTVAVQSELGVGSTFFVTLPSANPSGQTA